MLGGRGGPRGGRLAATYGDEFNVAFVPAKIMRSVHDSVRGTCEKHGRDPGSLVWSIGQVVCCGATEDDVARRAAAIGREVGELRENGLAGSASEVVDKMGTFVEAGAQRFYLQVLDISDLDHLRFIAQEVLPHVPAS